MIWFNGLFVAVGLLGMVTASTGRSFAIGACCFVVNAIGLGLRAAKALR